MKYFVQFMRFFEEFGFEDADTKEFEALSDAWNFCQAKQAEGVKGVELWQITGDLENIRLH